MRSINKVKKKVSSTSIAKIQRKEYEANHQFEDTWVVVHPWAKNVLGSNGVTICMVKCKTCSHLEGKDKFLQPKIGNLWKHVSHRKTLVDGNGLKNGDHHMKKDCKHVKLDSLQVGRMSDNVLDQLYHHATLEYKRRWVQLTSILHLMVEGKYCQIMRL